MIVILTRTLTMDGKVRKVLGVHLRSRGRIMFDFWSWRGCVVTLGKLLTSLCPCHQTVQLLRPMDGKYCDERVCLFACPLAYLKNIRANFTKFSVHVILDCCSMLFLRHWSTLCTSGFVDDVMFCHNGLCSAWRWQYRGRRRTEASSQNFQRIPQRAPRSLTLATTAAKMRTRAKFDFCDCLAWYWTSVA